MLADEDRVGDGIVVARPEHAPKRAGYTRE